MYDINMDDMCEYGGDCPAENQCPPGAEIFGLNTNPSGSWFCETVGDPDYYCYVKSNQKNIGKNVINY